MAHTSEEMGSRTIWAWAEEYAGRMMRGEEATENEYQRAEEEGSKHGIGEVSDDIANASDLAGG
jgi:hypothetical protein